MNNQIALIISSGHFEDHCRTASACAFNSCFSNEEPVPFCKLPVKSE